MNEVTREGGFVAVHVCSGPEGEEPETLSPDEAEALAAKLTQLAAAIRTERVVIETLCRTEGHRWDEPMNGYMSWPDGKSNVRECERCGMRLVSDGWVGEAEIAGVEAA